MFLILEIISYSWVSCIYVPHINKDKIDFKDNEITRLHCPVNNNEVKYNIQPIMKLKMIGESSW